MGAEYKIRKGTKSDSYNVFLLYEETLYDLQKRIGQKPEMRWDQPDKLAAIWNMRQSLYNHLITHADQFWIAEHQGQIIGFGRSMLHDGVRELTELFVKPNVQAAGIGKALMMKVFPAQPGVKLSVIASLDIAAQVRYFKSGVQHRFMVMYLGKSPALQPQKEAYAAEKLHTSAETQAFIDGIDRNVVGFVRHDTHMYLQKDRTLYKYTRPNGAAAGYGYLGDVSGPFALEKATDYPAVISLVESEAARRGYRHIGFEVPAVNHQAVNALLKQGFQIDPFMTVYMSSEPMPQPQKYILTSPPFVV